ncbi:hypothetical protein ACFV0O_20515 [Kitasatospora sp. NPDC059577]|uniref:hypothetical protein n=1 Tax=Kitasatospora sp. NPDC059577 TaxID=3346873 RepID=UPI003676F26B
MTDSETTEPPARPPGPGPARTPRPDWGAVGAIAGAVAAVVALVAYLMPPDAPAPPPATPVATTTDPTPPDPLPAPAPRPDPSPTPVPSPVPTPTASPEPDTPSPAPSPTPVRSPTPDPVSQPPLPAVRPGGCDVAEAALAAYRRNAGSSRGSRAAAAGQAYQDLMGAGLDAQGAVGATIRRLAAEFQELGFRLNGMVMADPDPVITDIDADSAQLGRLCGA